MVVRVDTPGQTHQKGGTARAASRRAAQSGAGRPFCAGAPAERGRVGSQRDPTHLPDYIRLQVKPRRASPHTLTFELIVRPPTLAARMNEVVPSSNPIRADGRRAEQLRPIRFQNHIAPHATGSTLIEWGQTRVICGVTIEETIPRWMKEQNVTGGWITAEYSMLPYSTLQRKQRDIAKGKIDGRSQEIQRLIGRSMRAAVNLEGIGPRTIWVDCDVLQADGGTRTAAITGGYVALALAVKKLSKEGKLDPSSQLLQPIAAVSMGVVNGEPLLDLCYTEDVAAAVDFNLVMNGRGEFIELQGSGEEATFSETQLQQLLHLGRTGIRELLAAQQTALC